jgi:hypothetical protein
MPELVTEKDIRLVLKHLSAVKRVGWGEVRIRVADGNIVFIEHSEGEQIKMDVKA